MLGQELEKHEGQTGRTCVVWLQSRAGGAAFSQTEVHAEAFDFCWLYPHPAGTPISIFFNVKGLNAPIGRVVSSDTRMDEEKMSRIYNEILLSHNREGNIAICHSMDRAGGCCAK